MWSLHHVTVLNIVVLAKWDGKVCSGIKLALRNLHKRDLEEAGSRSSAGKQGHSPGPAALSLVPVRLKAQYRRSRPKL